MANAIKKISVQRGYDVTEYVLNVFGGAGGQHACAVADALGMTQVLIHPLAGVLSAYGIGLADIIAMREQAGRGAADARRPREPAWDRWTPLERDARAEVAAEGVPPERITAAHRAHLRYQGTDTAVIVPVGSLAGHDRRVRGRVLPPLLASSCPTSRSSWRRCPSRSPGLSLLRGRPG